MNSSIVWAAVPKQCEIEGKVSQVASKQSGGMGGGVGDCSSLLSTVGECSEPPLCGLHSNGL